MDLNKKRAEVNKFAISCKLDLVVLYGSHARGDSHSESDIDIALRGQRVLDKEDILELSVELDNVFPRVEVVDLRSAPPLLLGAIVQDGKLLYEKHTGLYEEFCIRAVNEYLDYLPVLEALSEQNTKALKDLLGE